MKTIQENDSDFFCNIQAACFQLLTSEESDLVRASKTQVLFRKGDSLSKQGAFASYVLFVVKGLAKQYIEGEANRSYNLRIIKPGQFVGLSSVFDSTLFQYSSAALTDCQAILIEKDAIVRVAAQNGPFSFSIAQRYTSLNTDLFKSLQQLLFKQMNGRLADTLLYLDQLRPEFPEIFQLLSRKDLADFAGIATESTVKLLKSLEKEGVLELKDKDILIVDASRLQGISRNG